MDVDDAARRLEADLHGHPPPNTAALRAVRRAYSRLWQAEPAEFVLAVARALIAKGRHRWVAYELIRAHRAAMAQVDDTILREFSRDLASWDAVDGFGRTLVGLAWVRGQASDALVEQWTRSPDLWLRRLALVATVGLNSPGDGGQGDPRRTLLVCAALLDDREDMVVKALSWALRELSKRDRGAAEAFLAQHAVSLAPRVKREVAAKLRTGLKNPKGPKAPAAARPRT
jgi:3-methyladenine DNA glycosylase AlkD